MHSPNKPPVASDAKGRAEPPGFEYQFLEDSAPRRFKPLSGRSSSQEGHGPASEDRVEAQQPSAVPQSAPVTRS